MTSPGPGRPRNPRVEEAVLSATRELLVEVGYARLSYELVGRRAGVSRPTLYRRWPSKAHIVHDALFQHRGDDAWPAAVDFADGLRRMIRRLVDSYARPEAQAALPGLLADLGDPALRHSVLDALQQPVRVAFAERVEAGIRKGELRPGLDPQVVMDVVIGTVLQRVVLQQDADPALADQLSQLLLVGLQPAARPVGQSAVG
jgi:AcrR family transcriptional regulator